jgi:hypothetical protein
VIGPLAACLDALATTQLLVFCLETWSYSSEAAHRSIVLTLDDGVFLPSVVTGEPLPEVSWFQASWVIAAVDGAIPVRSEDFKAAITPTLLPSIGWNGNGMGGSGVDSCPQFHNKLVSGGSPFLSI